MGYSELLTYLIHKFPCFTTERLIGISKVCIAFHTIPNLDSSPSGASITPPIRILPLYTIEIVLHL